MAITEKDVEHVARLARLALTEEEKKNFTEQLGRILGYVEKLSRPDTGDVPPTAHPFQDRLGTVWREDRLSPWTEAEAILQNAPERDGSFFKVRKVIE